ncbi:Nucleoporin NDC1 [Borealophlyctis nickersoniae]|nr:Nucleoporin NDC1 [Borealophlyctis nickersoniae]
MFRPARLDDAYRGRRRSKERRDISTPESRNRLFVEEANPRADYPDRSEDTGWHSQSSPFRRHSDDPSPRRDNGYGRRHEDSGSGGDYRRSDDTSREKGPGGRTESLFHRMDFGRAENTRSRSPENGPGRRSEQSYNDRDFRRDEDTSSRDHREYGNGRRSERSLNGMDYRRAEDTSSRDREYGNGRRSERSYNDMNLRRAEDTSSRDREYGNGRRSERSYNDMDSRRGEDTSSRPQESRGDNHRGEREHKSSRPAPSLPTKKIAVGKKLLPIVPMDLDHLQARIQPLYNSKYLAEIVNSDINRRFWRTVVLSMAFVYVFQYWFPVEAVFPSKLPVDDTSVGFIDTVAGVEEERMQSALLGPIYAVYQRYTERDVIAFPPQKRTVFFALKRRLVTVLRDSVVLGLYYFMVFCATYYMCGEPIFRSSSGTVGMFTRASLKRSRWSMWNFGLLLHVYLAGALTIACWEMLNHIFEVYFTQPIPLPSTTMALSDLMSMLDNRDDPYMQHLAFYNLWLLARQDPRMRAMIFDEVDDDPTPWQRISESCMKVIDELSLALEGDLYGSEDKSIPVKSNDTKALPNPRVVTDRSPFKEKQRTLSGTIWQKLAEQKESNKPSEASEGFSRAKWFNQVPEFLRPRRKQTKAEDHAIVGNADFGWKPAPPSRAWKLVAPVTKAMERSRMLRPLWRPFVLDQARRRAIRVFKNEQLQTWAVQALAAMLVASATEDRYGRANMDIPKIVHCLLRCLNMLEEWSALWMNGRNGAPVECDQLASRQALAAIFVVKNAVYSITTTFYPHMGNYNFDRKYTRKLQGFLNFWE